MPWVPFKRPHYRQKQQTHTLTASFRVATCQPGQRANLVDRNCLLVFTNVSIAKRRSYEAEKGQKPQRLLSQRRSHLDAIGRELSHIHWYR